MIHWGRKNSFTENLGYIAIVGIFFVVALPLYAAGAIVMTFLEMGED